MHIYETESVCEGMPKLTGGPLFDLYQTATSYFLHHIDPMIHVSAYEGVHEDVTFAESEFAGKYLDTCVRYAAETGSEEALIHAKMVVSSIMVNQREDGYLGGLMEGSELEWFGIWNQAFTLIGLLSYYDLTKDSKVIACAERIGDYCAGQFLGGADINSGINDGSQHLSILLPMVRLYQRVPKPLFRGFLLHIIDKIKNSDNNFFSFDSIMDLRSKKGIENFVILLGLLEYAEVFKDDSAIEGCKKYWDELNRTQIRRNGNGTLKEFWTHNGNAPQILKVEDKPDENCVAVGWMELSTALFRITHEAKYLYALEKSLFNHLLGAADSQCRDFGYYQPNYGKRVVSTAANLYKCCRYRGYSIVSQLPGMLFWSDEHKLIPMIYTSCTYADEFWSVAECADYPVAGSIFFGIQVKNAVNRDIYLRLPDHYNNWTLTVDKVCQEYTIEDDYIIIPCHWASGVHTIWLTADISVEKEIGIINEVKHISYRHGSVLLAAEVNENKLESLCVNSSTTPKRTAPSGTNRVEYLVDNTKLVDYASAGRADGSAFTVWIPTFDAEC